MTVSHLYTCMFKEKTTALHFLQAQPVLCAVWTCRQQLLVWGLSRLCGGLYIWGQAGKEEGAHIGVYPIW